ncbi:hypothetical protein KC726_02695 [Candidatus Woesebacteria bacterium]|nr:hypothetical protein [Candidatus Woesebacteria bacterium]
MLDIQTLRTTRKHDAIAIGSHKGIMQSMLDFEFLAGYTEPSLKAIISTGTKYVKLFFGKDEVLIPVFNQLSKLPGDISKNTNFIINTRSARRVLASTQEAIDRLPNLLVSVIFAENVPEAHAQQLINLSQENNSTIIGPASIGILVPQRLKLGAIAGVQARQLVASQLFEKGETAVFSSSGGMTNELIRSLANVGIHLSFAVSFGGDRFPAFSPLDGFLAAEKDKETKHIVYFGELGGYDEYELIEHIKKGDITKPIICYIGGTVAEMFATPPQFGHAKAMAARGEETALAKTKALKAVGVHATTSFSTFTQLVETMITRKSSSKKNTESESRLKVIEGRKASLFVNSVSRDVGGSVEIVGSELLKQAQSYSYGNIVMSMLLGKRITSKPLGNFTEFVLKLVVDHGPYVSGAVNTMVAARAGKDLVSSLSSGLLTIGPRFGGALNQAAQHWLTGTITDTTPDEYVESLARQGKRIAGIGHRKYRSDNPDPRVKPIIAYATILSHHRFIDFALAVEKITTEKKGNLILNVDGAIAGVLLDLLEQEEQYSPKDLQELIDIEFFNALFVLGRSVGFTAHYLDQRRKDEGLFRLSPQEITFTKL